MRIVPVLLFFISARLRTAEIHQSFVAGVRRPEIFMNKKISLGAAVSLMIVVAAITICITMLVSQQMFSDKIASINERQAIYDKLSEIDQKVRQNYFGSIDETKLRDSVADGYVAGLGDKYAAYFSVDDAKAMEEENAGKSHGIGLLVVEHPDHKTMYVAAVHAGSPAEKAGIKAGDEIIAVGDEQVTDIGYQTAYEKILGESGTAVSLMVRSGETDTPMEVVRGDFEQQSVFYHTIEGMGYIKITDFNTATTAQFKNALEKLTAEQVKGLIFDVRGNGGGTVDSTAAILDLLLPEGDIISATYAGGKTEVLHKSDASETKLPMTVLTDDHTASAAELFAASIRDYQKGILIGTKTYGKGVMQRTFNLSDGSSVKFTIAQFNPPSGKNFDGVGLSPDTEVTLTDDQKTYFYFLSDLEDPVKAAAVDWLNAQADQ